MLEIILFGPFIYPICVLQFMLSFGTSLQVNCPGYNTWDNVYEFESSGCENNAVVGAIEYVHYYEHLDSKDFLMNVRHQHP